MNEVRHDPPPSCQELMESRPRLRNDLEVACVNRRSGQVSFRIIVPSKTPGQSDRFYRLGLAEYCLLSHLDGVNTVRQARAAAANAWRTGRTSHSRPGPDRFVSPPSPVRDPWPPAKGTQIDQFLQPPTELDAQQAEALILWAQFMGFFSGATAESESQSIGDPGRRWSLLWIRIPLVRDGSWAVKLERVLGWLFSSAGLAIGSFLIVAAFLVLLRHWSRWTEDLRDVWSIGGWLRLAIVWVVLKIIHETGHAVSCVRYGGKVGQAGIAWMLVTPVAYIDLSDAYRIGSRWRRVMTALAGVYVELLVAAVAVFGWTQTESPLLANWLSSIVLAAGFSSLLFNLNPLMRLDGYFALTDALDQPNLAGQASVALRDAARWVAFGVKYRRHQTLHPFVLITYAAAAQVYRITVVLALLLIAARVYGPIAIPLGFLVLVGLVSRSLWAIVQETTHHLVRRPSVGLRISLVLLVLFAVTAGSWRLHHGWGSRYPGVVEFADEAPIRTQVSGFAHRILVHPNQHVRAGQPLLVLTNPQLETEYQKFHHDWQQAIARMRGFGQQQDSHQSQQQQRTAEVLQQRLRDLQNKRDALRVVAPRDGQWIGTRTENQEGAWLDEGTDLGYVVQTDRYKVVVAVNQAELAELPKILTGAFEVVIGAQRFPATLTSVAEQTSLRPPHPALAATAGGPLPVRVDQEAEKPRLVQPHLRVEFGFLSNTHPLRSGQLAWIVPVRGSTGDTNGQHTVRTTVQK